MKSPARQTALLPILVAVALSAVPSMAHGGALLINGDFGSGLTGWAVSGDNTVTVSGGVATITESPTASEVDLFQTFDFKSSYTKLSFQITGLSADSAASSGVTPDAFGAALLDNLGNPLVSTVTGTTDSFYIRDLVTGFPAAQVAPGVTVSSNGNFPITVTIDTSSVGDVSNAELLFRVIGGTDPASTSSVSLDDVTLNPTGGGGPGGSAVPEPGSIMLFTFAALGLAGRAWRMSRRTIPH